MLAQTDLEPTPRQSHLRHELLLVFATVAAIKALLWMLDPTMRTFMGDSATYLWNAIVNEAPPDRSFTYALLIRKTALATANLQLLGYVQSAMGVLLCVTCYASLRADLGVSGRAATIAALVVALDPGQLFFERMVMTEAFGTFCFVLMVLAGLRYVRSGHLHWLLWMALFGTLVASLRLSLLPVVIGFAPLPVAVYWLAHAKPDRRGWHHALHLAFALVATLSLHELYKDWYDHKSDVLDRRDYTHATGRMRIGLLAPLVKPEHFERLGLRGELVAQAKPPSTDPRNREAQIWSETGLYRLIEKNSSAPDASARKIAMYAFRDDPLGLVRIGLANLADYFDPAIAGTRMQDDLGVRPPNDGLIKILDERYGHDARGVATRATPIFSYYANSSAWWITVLFALPFLAAAIWWHRRRDDPAVAGLLALLAIGMFSSQVLFSHIVSFRYLHPVSVIVVLICAYGLAPRTPASR